MKKWRDKGLLLVPPTKKTGWDALSAKAALESLEVFPEIRGRLAAGLSVSKTARFILDHVGEGKFTQKTMEKYCRLYRRFCIGPVESVESMAKTAVTVARKQGLVGKTVVDELFEKLEGLDKGLREIEEMTALFEMQKARIQKLRQTEEELGQFTLPQFRHELETALKILTDLIDRKMELGLPGYERVPRRLDLTGKLGLIAVEKLNTEETAAVRQFAQDVMEMMREVELKKSNNGTYVVGDEKDRGGLNGTS